MLAARKQISKPPPSKKRVLIVDDHPVVRHGFAQRINMEDDLEVCAQVATAHEAFALIDSLQPDIALVDISLDDGNGLDLIKDVRSRGDKVKILVVSSQDESVHAERCIRAGAQGYLQKNMAIDEIVHAIRRVLDDKYYLSERINNQVLNRLLSGSNSNDDDGVGALSDRELQVYQLIGQGMTVNQIADKLFLSPKTVETYRGHLKRKLKLGSSHELSHQAVRWVLENA